MLTEYIHSPTYLNTCRAQIFLKKKKQKKHSLRNATDARNNLTSNPHELHFKISSHNVKNEEKTHKMKIHFIYIFTHAMHAFIYEATTDDICIDGRE